MSSVIYYKFANSSRSLDSLEFSGVALTVDAVKRAIVANKKLRGADDEHLIITNASTGQQYHNDHALIHKNTTITVRRVPATKHKTLTIKSTPQQQQPHPSAPTAGARAGTLRPAVVSTSDIPVCPLCQRGCVDASVVDCCYQSFCDVCIRRRISVASAVACPNCKTANVTAANIKPNNKVRQRVAAAAATAALAAATATTSAVAAAATITTTAATTVAAVTVTASAATTLPQQTIVLPSPSVSPSPSSLSLDVSGFVPPMAPVSGKRERSDDGDSDASVKRRVLSVDNAR